jgi:hypothetical protein
MNFTSKLISNVIIICALAISINMVTANQAQAGFLIEPFLGYTVSGETESAGESDDVTALTYGARLGLTTLGFMYGIEYNMGNYTVKGDDGDSDGDFTNLGAFVGYEFPVMFRVWFSYYFNSTATPESEGNSEIDFKGSGTSLGLGYTGLPFVSINLVYTTNTFDEMEGTILGNSVNTSLTDELKMETITLGVSVPLP